MNSCKYWWADPFKFNPKLILEGVKDNFTIIEDIAGIKNNNLILYKSGNLRKELDYAIKHFNGYD